MPERRHYVFDQPVERPETAPAATPGRDLAVRLERLRVLILEFLQEVDTTAESEPPAPKTGVDFYDEVRRFEVGLIRSALTRTGGHRRRAARLLNLKTATLNVLIKRYGISPDAFKTAGDV